MRDKGHNRTRELREIEYRSPDEWNSAEVRERQKRRRMRRTQKQGTEHKMFGTSYTLTEVGVVRKLTVMNYFVDGPNSVTNEERFATRFECNTGDVFNIIIRSALPRDVKYRQIGRRTREG